MDADTVIGGPDARFPATRKSALDQVRDADPEVRRLAHDVIVEAYWKPVYRYLRVKWRLDNETAKDLTQGFFARALANDTFATWDSARASFRTFVRLCADRWVSNQRQYEARRAAEPVDESIATSDPDPEELFHREWVRQTFAAALEELRSRARQEVWRAFEMYDLAETDKPSYADVAASLGVPATQVTNYLAAARRDLKRIVLERVRRVTASDDEYRAEVRAVLGLGR